MVEFLDGIVRLKFLIVMECDGIFNIRIEILILEVVMFYFYLWGIV